MTEISFRVLGLPAPQGSKRAFRNSHTGRIHMVESSAKVKPWRQDVAAAAVRYIEGLNVAGVGWELLTGPVRLQIMFVLPRPKGHWRTGRNAHLLRDSAPAYPAGKPDISKLVRATEDALTNVVWRDDSQVVELIAAKMYVNGNERPGAHVHVRSYLATMGEIEAVFGEQAEYVAVDHSFVPRETHPRLCSVCGLYGSAH
jgi:Holliday junction resolvase RusA-like endonuclease